MRKPPLPISIGGEIRKYQVEVGFVTPHVEKEGRLQLKNIGDVGGGINRGKYGIREREREGETDLDVEI